MRTKITQAAVERVPLAPDGSAYYTDTELRGFMLIVGRTSKRYYAQTLVNGRQVRVKVGDHPALTAREAREAARQRLASMRAGTNRNEERRRARARGITLRQALELHLGAKAALGQNRGGLPVPGRAVPVRLARPAALRDRRRPHGRPRAAPAPDRAPRPGHRRLLDAGAPRRLQPGHARAHRPAAEPLRQRRLPRHEAPLLPLLNRR